MAHTAQHTCCLQRLEQKKNGAESQEATFIKNVAGSSAVQLLSGQNVVDAGHGSNFLLGGTGTDVFFLDARQPVETWDTIVGFHSGDIATLWGFKVGVSQSWWDDN